MIISASSNPYQKINVDEFIAVKGLKAIGKRLTTDKVKMINILDSLPTPDEEKLNIEEGETKGKNEDSPTQVKIDFE